MCTGGNHDLISEVLATAVPMRHGKLLTSYKLEMIL